MKCNIELYWVKTSANLTHSSRMPYHIETSLYDNGFRHERVNRTGWYVIKWVSGFTRAKLYIVGLLMESLRKLLSQGISEERW